MHRPQPRLAVLHSASRTHFVYQPSSVRKATRAPFPRLPIAPGVSRSGTAFSMSTSTSAQAALRPTNPAGAAHSPSTESAAPVTRPEGQEGAESASASSVSGLALPAPDEQTRRELQVGGPDVKLDHLGPVVVSLSRA